MSTPLSRIRELKENTREAFQRAKEAGDDAAMAELKALFEDIKRAEKRIMLQNLTVSAGAIAALSDRLSIATREINRSVDTFFVDDLAEIARDLAEEAGEMNNAIRNPPATETIASEVIRAPQAASPSEPENQPPDTPSDYIDAFESMAVKTEWAETADQAIDVLVNTNHSQRYRSVAQTTGVPWWLIAILHMLETSGNFTRHLHNGDPLNAPTVNKPIERPANWRPGMRWEESAADALVGGDRRLDVISDWSLGNALEQFEKWNGLGYRNRGLMSPYLWSGSNLYEKGKFVTDGEFDPDAVSRQVGAAVLLKRLEDRGLISISSAKRLVTPLPPAVLGDPSLDSLDLNPFPHAEPEISFPLAANSAIRTGADGVNARRVQEWCCLHGIPTPIDEDFGSVTAGSVRQFQTRHSLPITGEVDRETWLLMTLPMRRALASIEAGSSLNETLLEVARRHLLQKPTEVGGNNMGPWVRLYMAGHHGTAQRWCAGFVCTLVAQAARDVGVNMPFARKVSVDALVNDAKSEGRFVAEKDLPAPALRPSAIQPGTLFVIRKTSNDWTHVGIVTDPLQDKFRTIEGNTNGENVDGGNARASERGYKNRDFLKIV